MASARVKRVDSNRRECYRTEIELRRIDEGWNATQHGVSTVGTGDSAIAAVRDYCRRLETE